MSSPFPTEDICSSQENTHNSSAKPHPYETSDSFASYREFELKVINPAICAARECERLFFKSEDPPILAIQAPLRPSLEDFHNTILATDYNRTSVQLMPSQHYPVIPRQSAGIPILAFILGQFSSFHPDTFLAVEGRSVKVGDQVLLGEGFRGVKVGGVCEVGKNFVRYRVSEVDGHLESQTAVRYLVIPMGHFHPVYLRRIFRAVTFCFPFLFRSSAVFRNPGEVAVRVERSVEMVRMPMDLTSSSDILGASIVDPDTALFIGPLPF
jgi:hypothetical protein